MLRYRKVFLLLIVWAVFSLTGCSTDDQQNTALDIAVCAANAGPFPLTIDNPFSPFPVGQQLILEGQDDEGGWSAWRPPYSLQQGSLRVS
jgi:hypothetical protein